MAEIVLRGVPVKFPFEPYDLQKEYMEKVIECLQNESNGVLESPTGTGKTLSLLCSSLAWLQIKKAHVQATRQTSMMKDMDDDFLKSLNTELGMNAGPSSKTGRGFLGLPTIIYASRTHSQLTQAMQELKRTAYSHMKAIVIGSREQMCIHPEVCNEQSNAIKTQMCRIKVKTRSCHFQNRVERKKEDPAISQLSIIDIEDMVKLGETHKFCPYYMAKELKQDADIIFTPYNYLLDPRFRTALGVELSNNVVILDEAHNVEKVCEDSASLEIKNTDIALCIEEITAVMKVMSDDSDLGFNSDIPRDFGADELCTLKQILLDFEKEFDSIELKSRPEITVFDGSYIFEMLEKAGITNQNNKYLISLIDRVVQFLNAAGGEGPFQRRGNSLALFEDLLLIVFANATEEFKDKIKRCYKVHIALEESYKPKNNWLSKSTKKSERILNYWCFSAGFGMNMLMGHGVRSVILTSGTLAPLKPLISELEINVQVRLENPHIVKQNQVCVKVVPKGPDNEVLNGNYQNRDNPKYISSLGRTILNLSRIIPNGLLIFFPSYPFMQKCQQSWQEIGIWSDIYKQKAIYVEPKDRNTFNNTMIEYYEKVRDPNLKGAIFMGVCRGKVSEGLDFADANGRAVIVTGLPYPPLKDPRVVLKRRYLDICNQKDKEFLNGSEWYSLEATRAVNQAIGRVIRHKDDYGAIILLDTRFDSYYVKSKLSMWLRDQIKTVKNFGEIIRDLKTFYNNAEKILPAPKLKDLKTGETQAVPAGGSFSNIPNTYKQSGNFDFSSSSFGESSISSLESLNPNGIVEIKKRPAYQLFNDAKKKKIVLLQPNSNGLEESQTSKNTAKEYILMVNSTLGPGTFNQFLTALNKYKDTLQFEDLQESLDNIFITRPQLRYLIKGLEPYIKEKDKNSFELYWQRIR